ncbi:MAG: hypothetical protein ACXU86_06605 [Archangium sp.]
MSRLGEARLWRVGVVLLAAGLTVLPLASGWPSLALALLPLGTAFTFPCVTALLSWHAAAGERGKVLGMQQARGGMARALAPLGAGWAFEHLSPGTPCWAGAALALATLALGPSQREGEG